MVVGLSACSAPTDVRDDVTPLELQFGPLPLGARKTLPFTFSNPTLLNWKLVAVRRLEGPPVFLSGLLEEPGAVFTLSAPERRVEAHRAVTMEAAYDPPAVGGETRHLTVVEFDFLMGDRHVTKRLILEANALPFTCSLPVVLDFGTVQLGQTGRITYEFVNERSVNDVASLRLGDVLEPNIHFSADGSFSLAPGEVRTLELSFTPTASGPAEQEVLVSRSLACPESSVRLFGDGVELPVGASSTRARWTSVGEMGSLTTTFTNLMRTPVTLTQQGPDDEFELDLPLVIPAAMREQGSNRLRPGVLEAPVRFHPKHEGLRATTLTVQTDFALQPTLRVRVDGLGGSLRPVVLPGVVTLPTVPALTRSSAVVRLEAVGTRIDDFETWLQPALGEGVRVLPLDGSLGVLCVGNSTVGDACPGLPGFSLGAGAGVDLRVVVLPLAPGHHAFDVTLTTNGAPASVTFRVEVDAT